MRADSNLNLNVVPDLLSKSARDLSGYEAAAVCLKPDAGVGFVRCGSGPCYPHVKLSDVSH